MKKIKVFTIKPHSNFAEEISELEKTDRLINITTWVFGSIGFILLIAVIIINTTR